MTRGKSYANGILRHTAGAALATEEVARTRLGYDMLVKLKLDELLEQECRPTAVREGREKLDVVVMGSGLS